MRQFTAIVDPGRLYGDLTIEQLKTDHYQSRTRNKLIAEAFYLTRDIEKYGSGYIRVRQEIAAYPTMKFDYEESGDGYLVSVNYREQRMSSTTHPPEGANDGINGGINGGINDLLKMIAEYPGHRIPFFIQHIPSTSKRTIQRWFAELMTQGSIEYRGSKKTGGYYPQGYSQGPSRNP